MGGIMKARQVMQDEILPIGTKVVHNATKEVGIVVGECLGFGKVRVEYEEGKMWYPQPKRNISVIL